MSAKKKVDSKVVSNQKRYRRRLLTFARVLKYGLDSFIRNSWLSVAATAVMTITLLIIFTTFVAQNILTDTVGDLRNKVDMSIYLKTDTTDKVGNDLIAELKKLSSVRSVTYINAAKAREQVAQANSGDSSVIAAINEATNKTPATLRVVVSDINNTTQLEHFVSTDTLLKQNISPDYKPSFAGERRNTIQSIGRAVNFAQKVGIAAGLIFVIISALIIFNTIRMAIFNRKEEIQMMKLIGANQSFIRGPFLIEATIYGFIAALIATGVGLFGLYKSSATLASYQISVQPTIDLITHDIAIVIVSMIAVGALIGVVSSILATRRYLKL
jgi:cell division transport system permease protein